MHFMSCLHCSELHIFGVCDARNQAKDFFLKGMCTKNIAVNNPRATICVVLRDFILTVAFQTT